MRHHKKRYTRMPQTNDPSPTTRLLQAIGILMPPSNSDLIVKSLRARGIPVTAENFLDFAYPEGAPHPLPVELKQEVQRVVRAEGFRP